MRPFHSRCPHGRWTSLSSASGRTGTRRQKSSSCSSASSFRIPEVAVLLPDPLLLPWCLPLPSRSPHPLVYLHLQCLQDQQPPQCHHLPKQAPGFVSIMFEFGESFFKEQILLGQEIKSPSQDQ